MNNIVIKRQLVQTTNATIFGCASQEKRYKGERISILGGYHFVYFQKRNKGPAVWAFFQCQVLISFRLLSWCCWQAVPKATKKLGFIHSNCARLGFMCWDEKSVEVRSSRESITSSLTTIIDPAHCADFSTTDGDNRWNVPLFTERGVTTILQEQSMYVCVKRESECSETSICSPLLVSEWKETRHIDIAWRFRQDHSLLILETPYL